MNESEKRQVEEDFWKVMRDSIWYCARNVTRSASTAERRNRYMEANRYRLSEKTKHHFALDSFVCSYK